MKEIEEEMGTTTASVPDTSNIGYKKRDRRRKDDVEHMYRRNLVDKVMNILKRRKQVK